MCTRTAGTEADRKCARRRQRGRLECKTKRVCTSTAMLQDGRLHEYTTHWPVRRAIYLAACLLWLLKSRLVTMHVTMHWPVRRAIKLLVCCGCSELRMCPRAHVPAHGRWDKAIENYRPWDNGSVRVGIMGFGAMGRAAARLLVAAGYDVAAWARTPRGRQQQQQQQQVQQVQVVGPQEQGDVPEAVQGQVAAAGPGAGAGAAGASRMGEEVSAGGGSGPGTGGGEPGVEDGDLAGVRVYAGRGELRQFVERTDVLVCLLPLTPETQGVLWVSRGPVG